MKKIYRMMSLLTFFVLILNVSVAQTHKVSGVITDAATGEKLIGANVYITDLNVGAVTNAEGFYTIDNVKEGVFEVTVSYIGYLKLTKNIKIKGDVKLNIALEASSILLDETVVKSTKAVLRETPIAFSQIKGEDLEMKLASRDIPMELSTLPGIYATPVGGGMGDAALHLRGFDQRNIAVMINGVPVNDMETRSLYWSDWQGLGDVIDNIDIQRGLGASPYSINAVGGLINMTTIGVGSEKEYVKVKDEYGSNNLFKESISFHKKLSKNISATAYVAAMTWDGYAVDTYARSYTYFFSIGGVFGNHSLELTGTGAPQEHGQRALGLMGYESDYANSIYGHSFNKNVGRLHGDWFNDRTNAFHNPAFNLNWNWQVNKLSTLSTIFYFSFGRGYGTTTPTGSPYAPYIKGGDYNGFEDYDAIWLKNSTTINKTYSTTLHQSLTPLVESYNNHNWYGLLSTYTTKLADNLTFVGGIDGRSYEGMHYQDIKNLIGGDYYIDSKDVSAGPRMTYLGDKVGYYNNNYIRQIGGFGQLEYKGGNFTTFINLAVSTTGDKREDFFTYKKDSTTAWVNFFGYTAKTGFSYNIDGYNNVFINLGYFQNAPLANTIFANNTNTVSLSAVDEKVTAFEFGYILTAPGVLVKANAFYTDWKDRAMAPQSVTSTDPITGNNITEYANITGANQRNTGVEIEGEVRILRNLSISGNATIINPKYTSDVNASVFPEGDPTRVTTVHVYSNGLYVPDFPLNKYVFKLHYSLRLMSDLNMYIDPVFTYVSRFYSWYDIDKRINALDKNQPWRIPDYNITDIHIGFNYYLTDTWIKKINLNFHVFNLFNNNNYIVNATDGPNANSYGPAHSEINARVFYGRPRWINVGIALNF